LASCELGEQAFARFSYFSKTCSNHKIKDLFSNFLIQEHFSEIATNNFQINFDSSSKKETENMMHKFGKNHKWENVIIKRSTLDYESWMSYLKENHSYLAKYIKGREDSFEIRVLEEIKQHFEEKKDD